MWVQFYRVSLFSSTPVSFYAVEMKFFAKFDIARIVNSLQAGPPHFDFVTWLSNFLPFVIFHFSRWRPRSKGSGIQ